LTTISIRRKRLNRPRWCLDSGTGDSALALEEGIPVSTMSRLADLGHRVRPVSGSGRGLFGDGQIIRRDPNSVRPLWRQRSA